MARERKYKGALLIRFCDLGPDHAVEFCRDKLHPCSRFFLSYAQRFFRLLPLIFLSLLESILPVPGTYDHHSTNVHACLLKRSICPPKCSQNLTVLSPGSSCPRYWSNPQNVHLWQLENTVVQCCRRCLGVQIRSS